MLYDKPLFKEFQTTFVINVSHLSGEIFTLKNEFVQENIFYNRKKQISC